MGHLYERYYINNDCNVLVSHETFHCYTSGCHHDVDSPVPEGVINSLPESYYITTYPPEGILKRVNDLITLRFQTCQT